MNTNTMELNINEMENVNGGDSLFSPDKKKIEKSLGGKILDACVDTGKKAYVYGKLAIRWFSGLFD